MKILLIGIQNAGARAGYAGLFHPFGLAYISAVLKNKGHLCDCIDLHNEEVINGSSIDSLARVRKLDIQGYGAVGFGGPFLRYNTLKLLSEKIWEVRPNLFQIAGGNMATIIADIILKETKVNCICLNEGEDTIIELLDNVEKGDWRATNGIKYLADDGGISQTPDRGRIADLDRLPFPDRDSWSFDIVRKTFPYGSPGRYCGIIFASRGCPFSCIFCNPTSGKKIRSRSSENIIKEIRYLRKKWNVEYVRFFDENFIGSKEKIEKLCRLMISERLGIFWMCQIQAGFVDEDLLEVMKEAGSIEVSYGIESGSDRVLSAMRKGIRAETARSVIEMTYKVGIRPSLSFIGGVPCESAETLRETVEFIKSLNYINWTQIPAIGLVIPLPNTELYKMARENGLIANESKYLTEDLFGLGMHTKTINLTSMGDSEFVNAIKESNAEIRKDFYSKHPLRRVYTIYGLDHLRFDLMFRNFTAKQIIPIIESLLWACIGKKNSYLSRYVNAVIYKKALCAAG